MTQGRNEHKEDCNMMIMLVCIAVEILILIIITL